MALIARSFRTVPRPTSTVADNHQRKEIRSAASCVQQCGIACQVYSNWRTKCLRRNFMQQARICRTGRSTGEGRRIYAVSVESRETGPSDSCCHRRISKAEEGTEQEAGYFGRQAAGGSPKWMALPVHVLGSFLVGTLLFGVASANAVDALKTCTCLLKECRAEFARCLVDPGCAANIACLQTCNNRPDETNCQIGCGDLFDNAVVEQFNDCAVSRKGCVPQKQDEGLFPLPPTEALVKEFNTQDFAGQWYISSGYNKTFDVFNCQLHEFTTIPPDKISGKINWRVRTPDGGFIERSGKQDFVQDKTLPAALYNHDNPALHYKDDWYILSAKTQNTPEDYIFIYYRGSNDAWDGYGGAVVYTRTRTLPPSIVPELTKAAKGVGLDFNKFTLTDNTCEAQSPLLARLEKGIEEKEEYLVEEAREEEMVLVQEAKKFAGSVGKFVGDIVTGELNFFGNLFNKGEDEFKRDEQLLLEELGAEERALFDALKMEAKDIEHLFAKPFPIRKSR